jgi:outer membrane protein assembly factor BamD (BamD/ComL family)
MKGFVELIAVAALLLLGGCRKDPARISTAAPPVAVDYFQEGEKQFRIGNYAEAVKAYDIHLRKQPAAENQDLALLRLAIVYAVAPDPVRNPERSAASLQRLVTSFPQSTWRPQAELMLELRARVGKLQSEVGEKDDVIRRLTTEVEAAHKLDEQARRTRSLEAQAQIEKMKAEIKEREIRIRNLTTEIGEMQERLQRLDRELDALKRIDRQRRLSRPGP